MAHIHHTPFFRHLRSEPSSHVLLYRKGNLRRSGRGLALWFNPWSAAIAEVPVDDRELSFAFHGRSADFQDVTIQGVITYRVADAERLASRLDFSIDVRRGHHLKQPLDVLANMLTQLAQQLAWGYIAQSPVQSILSEGYDEIRYRVADGLTADPGVADMGLELVNVRVASIQPTPDLERALETPTRERIQQRADEAAFERRALAVEKERAIQENELQNQIELARREENLIAQQGENARRQATDEADAGRIEAEGKAQRSRISAESEADSTRLQGAAQADEIQAVEGARAEAERLKMDAYRDMPPSVLFGLAAQRLAEKLERIEHLNLSPETIGPALTDLLQAGARRLANDEEK